MVVRVTVIIATKDRAEALDTISLPSLLNQGSGFEVLIWDASGDDSSERVAKKYAPKFRDAGVDFRYERAPRVGLASQRNDSVNAATGDVLFFIDDDCEVEPGGVSTVADAFSNDECLMGAGLQLRIGKYDNKEIFPIAERDSLKNRVKDMLLLFLGRKTTNTTQMLIHTSTLSTMPTKMAPALADWLPGGDMAYRRSVFDVLRFDERLQRFGGYAMAEDVDMSHRVMLHHGRPLQILDGPCVIHRPAPTPRTKTTINMMAMELYNRYIIRQNFLRYKNYPLIPFIWVNRIGWTLLMIYKKNPFSDIWAAYKKYREALREQKNDEAKGDR